jgi:membrane-bound inhibitor of C-type lysozyme
MRIHPVLIATSVAMLSISACSQPDSADTAAEDNSVLVDEDTASETGTGDVLTPTDEIEASITGMEGISTEFVCGEPSGDQYSISVEEETPEMVTASLVSETDTSQTEIDDVQISYSLSRTESASGMKYSGDGLEFFAKADEGMLTLEDGATLPCAVQE